ncbi:UNKNOWN [Stylonychia lemnae]|uniref:TLDc domain-containing protein n=1 Tax=Stylonychia lemnae TaxID=5949 RepID=A0A078AVL0_STYLE|nr:UNKNOWN [Stylonychia lemnae]|eukprot:CDW86106.1 UNKNOWN [Stylonychia lemnae]
MEYLKQTFQCPGLGIKVYRVHVRVDNQRALKRKSLLTSSYKTRQLIQANNKLQNSQDKNDSSRQSIRKIEQQDPNDIQDLLISPAQQLKRYYSIQVGATKNYQANVNQQQNQKQDQQKGLNNRNTNKNKSQLCQKKENYLYDLKEKQDELEEETLLKMDSETIIKYQKFRGLVNEQLMLMDNQYIFTPKFLPLSVKTTLLYKATRDGYKASDFHKICDNKGPTITFILSEQGLVFGGYTSVSWKSTDTYQSKEDHQAFIFSLTNKTLHTKYRIFDHAVGHDKEYLMIFSGDIRIKDKCNAHVESTSELGMTYTMINNQKFQDDLTRQYLAGSYSFRVIEIEVYKASE